MKDNRKGLFPGRYSPADAKREQLCQYDSRMPFWEMECLECSWRRLLKL